MNVPQPSKPPGEAPSDADLVLRVSEGDRDALAVLYDRHVSTLIGLGVRVLRSRREAEDITHDVFIEVWRRAHTYDSARASVRGWLCLMMRCRSLDRRKSASFSLSAPLEHDPRVASGSVEGDLDAARATRALAGLPATQREVLYLGYFEGLSSSEIAAELSLPIGTVKSRVAAALRALRDALGTEPLGAAKENRA